jgi:DNA helicase-2/ATP-dependent DNA helicase PcrA
MKELSSKPASGDTELELKVGYMVEHDRFGKGKVTKLEGAGVDRKATIFFPHAGSKTLLLRFAKLTVLEE